MEILQIKPDLFCIKCLQMDNNVYLIVQNKQCIVIDPSFAYEEICHFLSKNNLTLKAIILTHCHYDHSWSTCDLVKKYNCQVFAHELDKDTYLKYDCAHWINTSVPKIKNIEWIEASNLKISNFKFDILLSPGHTAGSICVHYQQYLFTGDTLFVNGFGRYDFPNSNFIDLKKSINQIYTKYPKNVLVLPGHGDWDTISNIPRPL